MMQTPEIFPKPVDDYLRVATVSPEVAIADPAVNFDTLKEAYEAAKAEQAELVITPELSVTGYSTADLFHNMHVLDQTERCIEKLAELTIDGPAMVIGAPLRHNSVLYNCGVMLAEGKIVGAVPKVNLPNYGEFFEKRWFATGRGVVNQTLRVGEQTVPFGTDIIFDVNGTPVGGEICEDMYAPISAATETALAGALVIFNQSASNEVLGKPPFRHLLAGSFAARLLCGYIFSSAGRGESIADTIYGGHQFVYESNHLMGEREPLSDDFTPLVHDIDRTYLEHDRMFNTTWAEQAQLQQANGKTNYRWIPVSVPKPIDQELKRRIDPSPLNPLNAESLDHESREVFKMTSHALAQRALDAKAEALVIGLSGGLDSTLALLTAVDACKLLGKPLSFIHTVTMPGLASSEATQSTATQLANALGTTHSIMPISELSHEFLGLIGHDQTTEDLTYENTQARTRTEILMNYSGQVHGFVVGTGDMSENAVGYCTFNADQMSMYNPNAGISKGFVKSLVGWKAEQFEDEAIRTPLRVIRDTEASAELKSDHLEKTTDEIIGPIALRDFFHAELQRRGSRPTKIGHLALQAYGEQLGEEVIADWLDIFLTLHARGQWKRNVMTDGLKIGNISLSPRTDWRMAPNTSGTWFKWERPELAQAA